MGHIEFLSRAEIASIFCFGVLVGLALWELFFHAMGAIFKGRDREA